MNKELLEKIKAKFSSSEAEMVISKLNTVTLEHVMAGSQENLDNTHFAILQLSNGDLLELGDLVEAAKMDFRDVIYWASMKE